MLQLMGAPAVMICLIGRAVRSWSVCQLHGSDTSSTLRATEEEEEEEVVVTLFVDHRSMRRCQMCLCEERRGKWGVAHQLLNNCIH